MDPMDMLTTVNQFYDQAFNRLLIATFGLIAFIGVIVPIAVGWLQLRSLRTEKLSLLNELRSELDTEREKISQLIETQVDERIAEIKAEYDSKFKLTSEKIRMASAAATARAHHMQGTDTLNEEILDFGIEDLCFAASLYFEAKEEDNARRCMGLIESRCLRKINSTNYMDLKVDEFCSDLIEAIRENNQNSRYKDELDSLEKAMKKAAIRAPLAKNDGA